MEPSGSGRGFWDLLPHEEQRVLSSLGREREYPPGAALCVEGDPVTHVFVLLDGWVKVVAVTADGRESVLALRGTGDVVGETAGETTGVRNATMEALVSVRALIVGYERFSSFIDTHQGGSRAYRRGVVHRWRWAAPVGGGPAGTGRGERASLSGPSRATVARALNDWRRRGLIRTGQRRITLTDVPGLRRAAGQALA